MASNIVAYAGIDNFDQIMYLSRILVKMGKKVLIVDHSDTKSLTYSIPQPEGICSDNNIVTYRQVDFTNMIINEDLAALYDDILISYGFMEPAPDLAVCNRLVCVTDMYRFHYERELSCDYSKYFREDAVRFLLIKNAAEIKITSEIIAEKFCIRFQSENVSILYEDEKDDLNGLICHHDGVYGFAKISKQSKNYLIEEVCKLNPEIDRNRCKAACRKARKGE